MSGPVDIREIARALDAMAAELAAEFFPAGHREGNEWVEARKADGGYGDSLKITIAGRRRGYWYWFAAAEGGDMLDLVARFGCEGDKRAALQWARRRLGLDGAGPARAPAQPPARPAAADDADERRSLERKRKGAQALFLSARPIWGTPAEAYLAARGLPLRRLGPDGRADGRPPRLGALRYHPAVKHPEAGPLPALLACIAIDGGGASSFQSVQRIWLPRPGADPAKAFDKMAYCRFKGGCVRLWKGASGKPLRDAPAGEEVIVTEGIEDGLTLALAIPECRVLAAAGGMGALVLPAQIGTVTIAADNDPPTLPNGRPHPAPRALERAIGHFLKAGHDVKLMRAPAGKDFNDFLRAG